MDVSPYLSAIQSLVGENPGEKYKNLHEIAAQIAKNEREKIEFLATGTSKRVEPALIPHVRILVGNKLKLIDVVVEALKSDDVLIIKQALGAKWFFNAKNEHINVDYFIENVFPYISLRTRIELIKTLAHNLVGHHKKADEFFERLADLYGTDKALPLIVACSETYIFDVLIKRSIILPSRILNVLYRRYPELVIRYLRLINKEKNNFRIGRSSRNQHTFHYVAFLPALVKNHTEEFVELYECSSSTSMRLGSTRAESFLKNGTELLINKPILLLDLLPLKLVSNKLSTQQFETMFENLFPKDESECVGEYLESLTHYLTYYPQEKKFHLMEEKYRLLYGKSILDNKSLHFKSWLFKLLSAERKDEYAAKMLAPLMGKDAYFENQQYLRPSQSIPEYVLRIGNTSSMERMTYINNMINSCSLYDSKDDLLEVLQYINTRHKNERSEVLYSMFNTLIREIDIKTLDRSHWQIIWEFIQRAYIKADLCTDEAQSFATDLLNNALNFYLKQCKTEDYQDEAKQILDKLTAMVIECCLEHKMEPCFLSACLPELKRECLQKFLTAVPLSYPETHEVWKKFDSPLKFVHYLVESIHTINVRYMRNEETKSKRKCKSGATISDFDVKQKKLQLRDYPWLMKLSIDLFKTSMNCTEYRKRKHYLDYKRIVYRHDRELYQSIIDNDPEMINDIETFNAVNLLKYEHSKVISKWKLYLNDCREKLSSNSKAAKNFVAATKWHEELPIQFANQCLLEIEDKGSILVLGILLEGEAFGRVIEPYLPKGRVIDLEEDDTKKNYQMAMSLTKAMNYCNPPVSFDVISGFCQGDYVALAIRTLTSVAQRVPINLVVAFANRLVDKPISVKKLGIRLVFQVSSNIESREFLARIWNAEKNTSIREVVAKMIFDVFTQTPSDEAWQLIKVCMNGLKGEDKTIFEILNDVSVVNERYIQRYVQEYLKKIDSYGKDVSDEVKSSLVNNLIRNLHAKVLNHLSEELITSIVKRNFFKYSYEFIFDDYLFSESSKFNERLKTFMGILEMKFENYGKPDVNNPRSYPVNNELNTFFSYIFTDLTTKDTNDKEMVLKLVNASLTLISAKLKPWQDMQIFIRGNLAKDYAESSTFKDFGVKFVATVTRLMKEFKSDLILIDISESLKNTLNDDRCSSVEQLNRTFSLIDILMEKDPRLSALIGINLLDTWRVGNYDERYDVLVKKWMSIEDPIVQATLSNFQNQIRKYSRGWQSY